jgi:hypothetical protein
MSRDRRLYRAEMSEKGRGGQAKILKFQQKKAKFFSAY